MQRYSGGDSEVSDYMPLSQTYLSFSLCGYLFIVILKSNK